MFVGYNLQSLRLETYTKWYPTSQPSHHKTGIQPHKIDYTLAAFQTNTLFKANDFANWFTK